MRIEVSAGRRASARLAIGLSCEPVELLLGAGIAENQSVSHPITDIGRLKGFITRKGRGSVVATR
jgi:hypothetical protein